MKIAVFLPNWLGDLVMATPMLRAVRRHFGPETRIVGIMRPYLAEVLSGTDWLDEQWYFNPHAEQRRLRHLAVVQRLRREEFDLALLLPNSLRTAVVAWLGGVKERIGYARYGRGPLLTRKLDSPRAHGRMIDYPMVDYYLKLGAAAGCAPESPRLELATIEADERSADAVWENLGLRTDGRVVIFNSSGAYGAAKLWPMEHFGELARRVVDELDHDVLVMCGPKERDLARDIVRLSDRPRVFSMADQPMGIGTAKACIRRGRLAVSTDSGPRHVAAAFGKPVITMYGPMLPIWSQNPTVHAVDLLLDLECVGCQNRVCPLGHHRCMQDISVDQVYAEVARLVGECRAACAA
ncbi:MAG: lipopolysaccharide heptosyltransferase II [Pirellulales bacterium]|nr:lipopolysaccharide heptosyltransferase II [Pirellulales bacterium]